MTIRLFLYKAEHAPICILLRKETKQKKQYWQMIHWNLETNTFTPGQWLCNKQMIPHFHLSQDGQYCTYMYNQYQCVDDAHWCVSKVPYFTAIYYAKACGRRDWCGFIKGTNQAYTSCSDPILTRQQTDLPFPYTLHKDIKSPPHANSGYIKDNSFVYEQKTIRIDGAFVYVDDEVVYDATENTFENITQTE
jgi:hypothetical protein